MLYVCLLMTDYIDNHPVIKIIIITHLLSQEISIEYHGNNTYIIFNY